MAAKRVAVDYVTVEATISRRRGAKPPRLRFDRVVLGLLARLRAGLQDGAETGRIVMVTVTAPIRLASKTGAAIEEHARRLLRRPSASGRFAGTIHGNAVQIRIMRGAEGRATTLAGFVHNRDSDPDVLFDLAEELLSRVSAAAKKPDRRRSSRPRRLVIAVEDAPAWTKTCRHLCDELFAQSGYQRVLLVGADGEIAAA